MKIVKTMKAKTSAFCDKHYEGIAVTVILGSMAAVTVAAFAAGYSYSPKSADYIEPADGRPSIILIHLMNGDTLAFAKRD